jgi:hypothetical protein
LKIINLLVTLILLSTLTFAASDAVRVEGDLKVGGIHFSKDGSTINSANDVLKNKGTWTVGTLYSAGDVVQTQTGSYVCITATATQPPNASYWSPMGGAVGPIGPAGQPNSLSIGTVINGTQAAATITGAAPNQKLNLTLPQGLKGDLGPQGPACTPLGVICANGEVYVQTANGIQCGSIEPYPNAIGICVQGSCNLNCSRSMGNCDQNILNGCETSIEFNNNHCGVCGNVCGQNEFCTGFACVDLPPIIKVSVANVPSGVLVGGIQASFTLPIGTFLATNSTTGVVNSGVATFSGLAIGSWSAVTYNPTTRLVSFGVLNATHGFGNGEILTINYSISPGIVVQRSDFPTIAATSPLPLQIIDVVNLSTITGATCPLTLNFP